MTKLVLDDANTRLLMLALEHITITAHAALNDWIIAIGKPREREARDAYDAMNAHKRRLNDAVGAALRYHTIALDPADLECVMDDDLTDAEIDEAALYAAYEDVARGTPVEDAFSASILGAITKEDAA